MTAPSSHDEVRPGDTQTHTCIHTQTKGDVLIDRLTREDARELS